MNNAFVSLRFVKMRILSQRIFVTFKCKTKFGVIGFPRKVIFKGVNTFQAIFQRKDQLLRALYSLLTLTLHLQFNNYCNKKCGKAFFMVIPHHEKKIVAWPKNYKFFESFGDSTRYVGSGS